MDIPENRLGIAEVELLHEIAETTVAVGLYSPNECYNIVIIFIGEVIMRASLRKVGKFPWDHHSCRVVSGLRDGR